MLRSGRGPWPGHGRKRGWKRASVEKRGKPGVGRWRNRSGRAQGGRAREFNSLELVYQNGKRGIFSSTGRRASSLSLSPSLLASTSRYFENSSSATRRERQTTRVTSRASVFPTKWFTMNGGGGVIEGNSEFYSDTGLQNSLSTDLIRVWLSYFPRFSPHLNAPAVRFCKYLLLSIHSIPLNQSTRVYRFVGICSTRQCFDDRIRVRDR